MKIKNIDADVIELLKKGGNAFLLRILGILSLYGFTLYVTNVYGAEVYGEYAFFFALLKLLGVVVVFGLDTVMLRYGSAFISKQDWGNVSVLTKDIYKTTALLGLAVVCVLLFFGDIISFFLDIPIAHVYYLGITILPYGFYKINSQSYRANKEINLFAFFEYILLPLLTFSVVIVLPIVVKDQKPTDLIITSFILSIILLMISSTLFWLYRVRENNDTIGIRPEILSLNNSMLNILSQGLPFLLASSSLFIAPLVVQMFLKFFLGSGDLGIYDAVFKVAQLTMLPLIAINMFIAPKISDFYTNDNPEALKSLAQNSTWLVLISTLPIILIVFIFAKPISGLFGSEFISGATALRVLAVGQFVNALTGPVGIILQMTENQNSFKNIVAITITFSLLIAFFLIPVLGILGAAVANMLFQSAVNIWCLFEVNRKLKFNTLGRGSLRFFR